MNSKPCVIVCERTSRWATAIRRHLPREVRLVQTRALVECATELATAPASLAAVALTRANLGAVLDFVDSVSRAYSRARVIILADRGLEACEGLLCEAGAIHFSVSPRELAGLDRTIRNHFGRLSVPQAGFAETVWDSLPWSEAVNR
jgi:hypothetical protein